MSKDTLVLTKNSNGSTRRTFANNRYITKGDPKQGGIAQIFRAFDVHDERQVALKVFRPVNGTDGVVEESFRRETQALSDLKHRNIVQIFDSGFESETGEHYIAMEWVDHDLESICKTAPLLNWSSFYDGPGRQILEALAFAHSHATAHRDIKPTNVLLTNDGVVKVCDFGISKIRNFLEPGVTLAQYATVPFAPPEMDNGTYTYSRDVFGFVALAIVLLSRSKISDHKALRESLEKLELAEPIKRLLRRCLSFDSPEDRPQNAAVLLSEFDKLKPRNEPASKGRIITSLTMKVIDIIKYDLGLESENAVQSFIKGDLVGAAIEYQRPETKSAEQAIATDRAFRVYAGKYAYIGVRADGGSLKLVTALDLTPSELAKGRERALSSPFDLVFTGPLATESADNIAALDEALSELEADQKVIRLRQREQAIYMTWLNLLSAKTELERRRKRKLRYERLEALGGTVRFTLSAGQDAAVLDGQNIRVEAEGGEEFMGEVVSFGEGSVLVQQSERNRVDAGALPSSGSLGVDTTRTDAALDKQRAAVDAVRYGRSVNSTLGEYVVNPGSVLPVIPCDVTFIQSHIDDDKKVAVRTALAQPPLMVVQGPPGTGKTTFITELVLQTLTENPEARILLTSQTHVALDNSLEKISKEGKGRVRAVRIGHENDDRISASTRPLLVDNKLPVMRKESLASGRNFIEKWALDRGVPLGDTRMAMALEVHAGIRERLDLLERQSRGTPTALG
jgi:tRNA A-37 threonylcarbamoyl transferase component Bud32